MIGESGLTEAVHAAGYIITDLQPDYVVLGETHGYNLRQITRAIRLIAAGARFVATNPDRFGAGRGRHRAGVWRDGGADREGNRGGTLLRG